MYCLSADGYFHRIGQFCADFFVWNKCRLGALVVSQITKVDEERKYVIFVPESYHIILEGVDPHLYAAAGKHCQLM